MPVERCAIIIPVYKVRPDLYETASLKRCAAVLAKRDFVLVCPDHLDIGCYTEHLNNVHVSRFNEAYFEDIAGYNRLMLSSEFYHRFSSYPYLLIYQLDAYVFRDELDFWLNAGYDYIGAPWPSIPAWGMREGVGNGGLSLRNTSAFISVLHRSERLYNHQEYQSELLKCLKAGRLSRAMQRTVQYVLFNRIHFASHGYWGNEDLFWSTVARRADPEFRIPSVDVAAKFSLELKPEEFLRNNPDQMPFGCHAWPLRYREFWCQYISLDSCTVTE